MEKDRDFSRFHSSLEHLRQVHFTLLSIIALSIYLSIKSITTYSELAQNLIDFKGYLYATVNDPKKLESILLGSSSPAQESIINNTNHLIKSYIQKQLPSVPSQYIRPASHAIHYTNLKSRSISPNDSIETVYAKLNNPNFDIKKITSINGDLKRITQSLRENPLQFVIVETQWKEEDQSCQLVIYSERIGSGTPEVETKTILTAESITSNIINSRLQEIVKKEDIILRKHLSNINEKTLDEAIRWANNQLNNPESTKGKTFKLFDLEFDSVDFSISSSIAIILVCLYFYSYIFQVELFIKNCVDINTYENPPWIGLIPSNIAKTITYISMLLPILVLAIYSYQFPISQNFFRGSILLLLYPIASSCIKLHNIHKVYFK